MPPSTSLRIAVVGAGPRGASVVERLAANHELAHGQPIEVALFDPHPPGSGRVWTSAQPHHLLMNTLCADATHFTDQTVKCQGPVVQGPTLFEWATTVAPTAVMSTALDPAERELLDEVTSLHPWSHPSRKLLGRYLEWCHAQDVERMPAGMSLTVHRDEVTAVRPSRDSAAGFEVATSTGRWHADAVVIATGHSDLIPSERERTLHRHAQRHRLFFGPPSNPIDQDLSGIRAGAPIAVRGLGMNFFDYMSLLTVGRGGRYRRRADGGLDYLASGREPVLVAGSRRGVPYRAKGAFQTMTPTFERRYLTDRRVAGLRSAGRQLDFMTDLWPYIAGDAAYTYYTALAHVRPQAFAGSVEELVAQLDRYRWGDARLHDAIAALVPGVEDRLDLDRLDRPLRGRVLRRGQDLADWWRADLAEDYRQAQLGFASPVKCASVALGAGRAAIRVLARYGGFTGRSYSRDIEGWFRGFAGALASGPPAERIAQLLALLDAGVVVPLGPGMVVEARDGAFVAHSPAVPDVSYQCRGLLEAHLPPADAVRTANPLLRQLVGERRARPYAIADPPRTAFRSGAIEVGPEPYRLVDGDGAQQPGLFAVGVPLESIHWGTQLGPLAWTNSRFLRDTDAVARAALEHAHRLHRPAQRRA